jgi:hypothetical protein
MFRRPLCLVGLVLCLAGGSSCGPAIDLAKAATVTDVFTGWYDAGIKDGMNHLVPSISFKLHNASNEPATSVFLTVAFWIDGDDGDKDAKEVRGIGREPLAAGATTDTITVVADFGYTSETARADFFANSKFKDWTAKLFAKRDGRMVRLGEYKIERHILPHVPPASDRP